MTGSLEAFRSLEFESLEVGEWPKTENRIESRFAHSSIPQQDPNNLTTRINAKEQVIPYN